MKYIFLLAIMLTLAACNGGAVETLSDEAIQTAIAQNQVAQPTNTEAPTDTPLPTEIPPTETPQIETPKVPQRILMEKWEFPLFAIAEVASFCNYLLDMGDDPYSQEFSFVALMGGFLFDSIGDVFVMDEVEYHQDIANHMVNIDQLYGQVDEGKITPEEFAELLSIECNATMNLRRKIAEAAKDEGLTEASIESIIKDAETFVDNVFESIE